MTEEPVPRRFWRAGDSTLEKCHFCGRGPRYDGFLIEDELASICSFCLDDLVESLDSIRRELGIPIESDL